MTVRVCPLVAEDDPVDDPPVPDVPEPEVEDVAAVVVASTDVTKAVSVAVAMAADGSVPP